MAFLLAELPRLRRARVRRRWLRGPGRWDALDAAIEHVSDHDVGIALELGVYRGKSITRCAKKRPRTRFVGFDSFEGLPEDGRRDWKIDFAVEDLPRVPTNVELVKGWFSDTLPRFLAANPDPIKFVHIDCDIYSSTCEVFRALEAADRLMPGVVLCFDELLNYDRYLWNEMLALFEMLERTGLGVDWLAVAGGVYALGETIGHLERGTHPSWERSQATGFRPQAALLLTARRAEPRWPVSEALARDLAARFDALGERSDRG